MKVFIDKKQAVTNARIDNVSEQQAVTNARIDKVSEQLEQLTTLI
jgi:hypothetical protein